MYPFPLRIPSHYQIFQTIANSKDQLFLPPLLPPLLLSMLKYLESLLKLHMSIPWSKILSTITGAISLPKTKESSKKLSSMILMIILLIANFSVQVLAKQFLAILLKSVPPLSHVVAFAQGTYFFPPKFFNVNLFKKNFTPKLL